MTSLVTMTLSMVPSIFTIMMARMGRGSTVAGGKPDKPARPLPPKVLTNLPEIDKVDIRALLRKWEE